MKVSITLALLLVPGLCLRGQEPDIKDLQAGKLSIAQECDLLEGQVKDAWDSLETLVREWGEQRQPDLQFANLSEGLLALRQQVAAKDSAVGADIRASVRSLDRRVADAKSSLEKLPPESREGPAGRLGVVQQRLASANAGLERLGKACAGLETEVTAWKAEFAVNIEIEGADSARAVLRKRALGGVEEISRVRSSSPRKGTEMKVPVTPTVGPHTLPSRGFFTLDEVFQGSDYHMSDRQTKSELLGRVQGILTRDQVYSKRIDGEMGEGSQVALIHWQEKNSLEPTGRLDNATLLRLGLSGTPVTPATPPAGRPVATKDVPYVNSLGLEFIPLPGKPGVLMCRTETRVRDFERFVQATGHDATEGAYTLESGGWKQVGGSWRNPRFPSAQTPDHPVVCVCWADARAFCDWLYEEEGLRYRLPTDEEWTAAVGVGKYPWGGSWPPPAGAGNYAGEEANTGAFRTNKVAFVQGYRDGASRTAPVASYSPNRFGFYDLGGNVAEWCQDWFRMSMNEITMNDPDVQKIYRNHALDDGGGNKYRVLRGGSWFFLVEEFILRSSFRAKTAPSDRYGNYGFRCVLEVGSGG